MKLLSLNIWGGRLHTELFDYLKLESVTTDIFCFQEVFNSEERVQKPDGAHLQLFSELQTLLPDFNGYFCPTYKGWVDMRKVDFEVEEGQAIFVKKKYLVKNHSSIYIYGNANTAIAEDFTNEPKNMQYLTVTCADRDVLIANVHGKWHPGDKLDTTDRLTQSKIINDFLQKQTLPKVLCGDFNLMPETNSIKILEQNFRNLITEYTITNTRNKISWDQYTNTQHFADFTFVSPEIIVKNFTVPYNEVSDHLPMILEFEI